ncbi:serum response factor homolog isoform X2 [Parasteatoda tepidariorum]|uniref:serum response factor homolog isoform X2 n=1 Tax=Parasteatoda tepidariorum TaxID=114398 RepID=UPI00077FCCC1|nr:serum response factor homolog isoform X2 [Parasteatoda tepidariorum]
MQTSCKDRIKDINLQIHQQQLSDSCELEPMVLGDMNSDNYSNGHRDNYGSRDGSSTSGTSKKSLPANGKKTKGRVKIKMEFIDNKLRRYTTFSKRKTGIMKKAYELSTLTGTQVMLLVASETGHVYTFATRKLQPMITSEAGKALIQTCLNSPDLPPGPGASLDQRMSATGFEETDLTYSVPEDCEKMPDSPDNAGYSPPSPPENVSDNHQRVIGQALSSGPLGGGAESSSSSHNNSAAVQSSNLSVVSGSVVLPQTILQTNNNGLFYHTGQGLVYAAAPSNLSDSVVLNLGQEHSGGSQQQFITIPVSLSLSSAQQQLVPVSNQSSSFRKEKNPRK